MHLSCMFVNVPIFLTIFKQGVSRGAPWVSIFKKITSFLGVGMCSSDFGAGKLQIQSKVSDSETKNKLEISNTSTPERFPRDVLFCLTFFSTA